MWLKKVANKTLQLILLITISYGIYYAWFSFPIISGFSAKNACSCFFIQGRSIDNINREELSSFPLSIASIEINKQDSAVTGTTFGFAKRKAIYRKGLGCTLINGTDEKTLRSQSFSISKPQYRQDSMEWPMGDRMPENKSTNFDNALMFAFNHQYNDKKVFTRAVVIIQYGKLVAERYAPGYDKRSRFLGWSIAKSITGALIGILVKQGKLKVKAPAPVGEWKNKVDQRHKITIEHLLQQRSGLDFRENYVTYSNVTDMLFNQGNMASFTASLPLKHQPGSVYYYSSGNSNLLSGIIRTTVGEENYHAFPYTALFYKTGMTNTLLEPDASGTFVGSSYVYASARDYARFGLLYLNDGIWNGERILPEGWVQQTITPPSINKLKNYGYQFWLNGADPANEKELAYPEAPADMFYADGYEGQRIYIIPSKQLVIVRLGLSKFDEHQFLKRVLIGAN